MFYLFVDVSFYESKKHHHKALKKSNRLQAFMYGQVAAPRPYQPQRENHQRRSR